MATVHLIHGFLGVGKTSFARRLEQSLPAIRFTHDEWMARLYGTDPPPEIFPEYFRRVSDQIASVWPRCAELGCDVVLDLNFWSRRHRQNFLLSQGALDFFPLNHFFLRQHCGSIKSISIERHRGESQI